MFLLNYTGQLLQIGALAYPIMFCPFFQPMAMEQVISDRDSEDEVDDDVANFEDRRVYPMLILV